MSDGMPQYRRCSTEAQYPCVEQGSSIQFQVLWNGKPARAAFRYDPEVDHAAITAIIYVYPDAPKELWTVPADEIRPVYDFENDKRVFSVNEEKKETKQELVLLSPMRPLTDWLSKRIKRAQAAKETQV